MKAKFLLFCTLIQYSDYFQDFVHCQCGSLTSLHQSIIIRNESPTFIFRQNHCVFKMVFNDASILLKEKTQKRCIVISICHLHFTPVRDVNGQCRQALPLTGAGVANRQMFAGTSDLWGIYSQHLCREQNWNSTYSTVLPLWISIKKNWNEEKKRKRG